MYYKKKHNRFEVYWCLKSIWVEHATVLILSFKVTETVGDGSKIVVLVPTDGMSAFKLEIYFHLKDNIY